jgi:predicted phosphodiesterase
VLRDGLDLLERNVTTRIAAFGGVYSNDAALDAVLRDVGGIGVDHVRCLGDLGGFGPYPDRSIERLRESDVASLRGNYDDSVGHDRQDCACGYRHPRDRHFAQRSFDYTVTRTSPDHKRWMRELPEQDRLEIGGCRLLLCHGSPRQVNEFLWESTCSTAFLEWLCEAHAADVIVCSHTGLPWQRPLPSGRLVVNAGVIGRPANDGRTEAAYAVIEPGPQPRAELRRVGYDHEALVRDMMDERLPEEFVETIATGWWTSCLECLPARERRAGRY